MKKAEIKKKKNLGRFMTLPYGIYGDIYNHARKKEKLFMFVIKKTIGGYRKSGQPYIFCMKWPNNDEVASEIGIGIKSSDRVYVLKKSLVEDEHRLIEWKVKGQMWVAPNPALLTGENLKKTYFKTKREWTPNGYLKITIDGEVFDSSKQKPKPKKKITLMKESDYPDWLNKDLWNEYKEHREEIGKPFPSSIAEKKMIDKLENLIADGEDQERVIENTIICGWTGLFPVQEVEH